MHNIILNNQNKILLEQYSKSKTYEVCALLFGKGDKIKFIFYTKNTDKSPVHFTISSEELIDGYKLAVNMDMDVIGIFHSHPNNKAYPSITDERFMKTNTGVWIIYSGTEKNMKAFVLGDNEKPKEIRIADK
jgi:proteasome lid subunit RPN8/RPN11